MDKYEETYETKGLCKSVFKSGKNAPTISRYTEVWIKLINKIGKSKNFSL